MESSLRGIYEQVPFGRIELKLNKLMDEKGINRNQLASLTGVKYDVVTRYYNGVGIERADLTILAKFCYVLRCDVGDLLEYVLD